MKTVNGIRKKIFYGFTILACLLLLSGLISYVEISQFGHDTRRSMDADLEDIETATMMLESVHRQNTAVLKTVYGFNDGARRDILFARGDFYGLMNELGVNPDGIKTAAARYDTAVDSLFAVVPQRSASILPSDTPSDTLTSSDADRLLWLETVYEPEYRALCDSVKSVIIRDPARMAAETELFRGDVYRAGMPVIITLAVSILVIMVFYLLINFYYIDPVLKITRSLGNYLDLKIPFNVKVEGRDEVVRLKEYITELITMIRKKEQQ